jgi:hypothetical protein
MITPRLPSGHQPGVVTLAATASRLVLWAIWEQVAPVRNFCSERSGVDVLALGRNGRWTDITGGWPQGQTVQSAVFTGGSILIPPGQAWCGSQCATSLLSMHR